MVMYKRIMGYFDLFPGYVQVYQGFSDYVLRTSPKQYEAIIRTSFVNFGDLR